MSGRPAEQLHVHTSLLKCALEVEDSRAYWAHTDGSRPVPAHAAFEQYWFGARSLARVQELLASFRARFDAFPAALSALHRWPEVSPDDRRLVCHWHVQLADPLYRTFTGRYLVERREEPRPTVSRSLVLAWVEQQGFTRQSMTTRIDFASKLLSAAFAAGLVATNRDPRPLALPRVSDRALEYLLHLLREVDFAGTLLDNPYLGSVGLVGPVLQERLRALSALGFRRQGDLVDFHWSFASLSDWAQATFGQPPSEGAQR